MVRNAVTAVMAMPTSAEMICQYTSQPESRAGPCLRPETRIMVTEIMRMVRQRERARASFWVQRILTFQIRRMGIARTLEGVTVCNL